MVEMRLEKEKTNMEKQQNKSMSWPTKKLGEVCEIRIGKTPRRGVAKYWTNGTLPWATISEVRGAEITNTNERITETATKELNMSPFPRGTVLYTFKLSIGRVGIAGVDLFTNEAIAGFLIKDRKELMPEWLFYVLPLIDYKPFLSNAVKGNTLNKSSLKLLPIPLPPLKLQKQIVERMDKIAEAQRLNDELIQKADELFQSLLHQELNPVGKNWGRKKISEIVSVAGNKFIPKKIKRSEYQASGLYPVVDQGANLISGYINEEGYLYKGKLPIIIFGDHTRIFKFIYFPFAVGADGTKTLISKFENILPHYLYYAMLGFKVENLGYKRHFSILKHKTISIPPTNEQKQIVEKLSAVQRYKKGLVEQKAKLKELFDSVLQRSMNGGKSRGIHLEI